MTSKLNFLIKAGWAAGILLITGIILAGVAGSGAGSLDKYEQWVRMGLYPPRTVRAGYYLETVIESPKFVQFRQQLFGNWLWIGLFAIGIWQMAGKRTGDKKSTGFNSLWWMAVPIFLGLILYLWQSGSIPPAVYTDEAVTGYNAYSVLLTGKDEYGQIMPVLFKYLGSWLPGLNIYLLVPLIKIIGLGAFVIRFQSAVFGILLVTVMYVLIRLKTKNGRTAVIGAVLFAIIPWVVFYARTGYETLPGLMLFAAGAGLLQRTKVKPEYALWGVLALSLSTYMAHMFRYLLPFLLTGWAMIYREELKKWTKSTWIKFAAVIVLVNFWNLWLSPTPAFWVKNQIYKNVGPGKMAENLAGQVKIYLSPLTYFAEPADIDIQHQIPGTGPFYWWMIVPFVTGIVLWIRNFKKNLWWWWVMLVAGIPAVMSGAFISMQRAVPLVIPMGLLIADGMGLILGKLPKKAVIPGFVILILYSGLLLFRSYFVLLPGLNAEAWNYGYEQLANVIRDNPGINFVIDNSRNPRNYVLPLFYLKYPPAIYQRTSISEIMGDYYYSGATQDNHQSGNMEFRPIVWKSDPCREEIIAGDELAISGSQAAEHKLVKLGEVRDKTGKMLLQWYKTNPKEKCGLLE